MSLYVCPMHNEVSQDHPGRCTKCGMELVIKGSNLELKKNLGFKDEILKSYLPIVVIISLILTTTLLLTYTDSLQGRYLVSKSIAYFMTGFFLVFSGFKLIDLKGFAQGYASYDLLAQKLKIYGFIYPFIELFFGFSMLLNYLPVWVLVAEILIMGFSGLGVALKLVKHERFQCACLGTLLKVPLTKITLIEDFGMVILALVLLFGRQSQLFFS